MSKKKTTNWPELLRLIREQELTLGAWDAILEAVAKEIKCDEDCSNCKNVTPYCRAILVILRRLQSLHNDMRKIAIASDVWKVE